MTTARTDAEILDWLERNHTLHREVRALYVVDSYQVEITHDGFQIPGKSWHGATLREAYSKAMAEWDVTHGNRDLLAEPPEPAPPAQPEPCGQWDRHNWIPDGIGGHKCSKCGEILDIPF